MRRVCRVASIPRTGWFLAGWEVNDALHNLLADILNLLTQPFVIGDQIRAGSHEYTVEDACVRATVLRTYDNQRVLPRTRRCSWTRSRSSPRTRGDTSPSR